MFDVLIYNILFILLLFFNIVSVSQDPYVCTGSRVLRAPIFVPLTCACYSRCKISSYPRQHLPYCCMHWPNFILNFIEFLFWKLLSIQNIPIYVQKIHSGYCRKSEQYQRLEHCGLGYRKIHLMFARINVCVFGHKSHVCWD